MLHPPLSNNTQQARLPLSQGPGSLPLGSFEFPFAFALPRALPGSMEINNRDARGHVQYKVTARLQQSGLLAMGFKAAADLRVLQRLARPPAPLRAAAASELTSGCCCLKTSEGRVLLRLDAPTDSYCGGRGRGVAFAARVENRANAASVTRAEASLVKVTTFYDRSGHVGHVETEPVSKLQLPLPYNSAATGGRAALPPGGAAAFGDCLVPLPPRADPCVDGRLVKVHYELRLEAGADGFLMSTPLLRAPLRVSWDPAAARAPSAAAAAAGGGKAAPGGGKAPPAAPAPGFSPLLAEQQGAPAAPPPLPDGWSKPQVGAPAAFAIDGGGEGGGGGGGSVRVVSQQELDAIAAAIAAADAEAAAAAAAEPSAPPLDGGGEASAGAPAPAGGAASYPAVGGAGAASLPHDAGWVK